MHTFQLLYSQWNNLGSGKKGGQGWGETLVITIVVQDAGYYPPSLHARSLCTGRRVSVSFYVSLRDLRSNPYNTSVMSLHGNFFETHGNV